MTFYPITIYDTALWSALMLLTTSAGFLFAATIGPPRRLEYEHRWMYAIYYGFMSLMVVLISTITGLLCTVLWGAPTVWRGALLGLFFFVLAISTGLKIRRN